MIFSLRRRQVAVMLIIVGMILTAYFPFIYVTLRSQGIGGWIFAPFAMLGFWIPLGYLVTMIYVLPDLWRGRLVKDAIFWLTFMEGIATGYVLIVIELLKDQGLRELMILITIYGIGIILLYAYSVLNLRFSKVPKTSQ